MRITVNRQEKEIQRGLVGAGELYDLAGCGEERLFLRFADDESIPLSPADHMVIRGGEVFATDGTSTEDGSSLRKAVRPLFNGKYGPALQTAKIAGAALKALDKEFPQGRLFVDIEGDIDTEIDDDMIIVVQDADSFFVIPGDGEDLIDIESCGKHDRQPPKGYKYRIRVDREKYVVQSRRIAGAEILALAGKSPDEWSLNQKLHGGKRVRIQNDEVVDLALKGIERFETVRRQAQQGRE